MLFDVYDDVVALDDSVNPSFADYYQIKSKVPGTWTIHALTVQSTGEEGLKPSILGKLYQHFSLHQANVRKLAFISNAPFSVTMPDDTPRSTERTSLCLNEIHQDELTTVEAKLTAENTLAAPPTCIPIMHLETCAFGPNEHEIHTEGLVSAFLAKQGDGTIPPRPFHKVLQSEIRLRNNKEYASTVFADILKHKGLERKQFQEMLNSIPSQRKQDDLLTCISTQLTAEHCPYKRRFDFISDLRIFLAERQDQTNLILADATKRAVSEVAKIAPGTFPQARELLDSIDYLSGIQAKEFRAVRDHYSSGLLQALFAVTLYEYQPLSPASPQPEEESP